MRSLTTFGIFATLLGSVFVGSLFVETSPFKNEIGGEANLDCPKHAKLSREANLDCPKRAEPSVGLDDDAFSKALQGLWEKRSGDNIRFYYFHSGNVGLYRYGKSGTTTPTAIPTR